MSIMSEVLGSLTGSNVFSFCKLLNLMSCFSTIQRPLSVLCCFLIAVHVFQKLETTFIWAEWDWVSDFLLTLLYLSTQSHLSSVDYPRCLNNFDKLGMDQICHVEIEFHKAMGWSIRKGQTLDEILYEIKHTFPTQSLSEFCVVWAGQWYSGTIQFHNIAFHFWSDVWQGLDGKARDASFVETCYSLSPRKVQEFIRWGLGGTIPLAVTFICSLMA